MEKDSRYSGSRQPAEGTRRSGELLDDVQIAAAIQSALLALAPSTGLRVDVDAEEGTVYLRGEVVSEWQKAEAERLARSVKLPGVKQIRNELVVNPLLPPLPHP